MPMNVKTTGIRETQKKLTFLEQAVRTSFTRKALAAGAAVIAAEQRMRAPVLDEKTPGSTALEPGALKAGIRVRIKAVDPLGYFTALIGPRKGTRRTAHSVEYGFLLRKDKGRKVIGHVPANPFLRQAFDTTWQRAQTVFAETLKALMKGGLGK